MHKQRLDSANANPASVIALHCSGAGASQWRALGEALGSEYELIAPERYGCEQTGPWTGTHAFTLADEAISRMAEPNADLLRRFTDIDHQGHVALLACVAAGPRETMVGEARYIVDEVDPTSAEFAVAVAGGWQGKGLWRMLLERLISHAVAAGMTRLVGDTLANNAAMIALARDCGFTVAPKREDRRLMRLAKDLTAGSARARSEDRPRAYFAATA